MTVAVTFMLSFPPGQRSQNSPNNFAPHLASDGAGSTLDAVKQANEKGTALVKVVWQISGSMKGSGEIQAYTIPGGKMVHTMNRGSYETCESTYLRLFDWMAEHNLTYCGHIREMYPNNPL